MKVLLLIAACIPLILSQRQSDGSSQELLKRASAQLERLAPFRRPEEKSDETLIKAQGSPEVNKYDEQQVALEIFEILPEEAGKDDSKRINENRIIIDYGLLSDPKYAALMQERIKRSDHTGYGPSDGSGGSGAIITGSGSLISGIASGLLGGIAGASGGLSRSSSSHGDKHHHHEYGNGHPYDDKSFDAWDFKKAIFNTVVQALKAISGGVIALKGQLIKGSGYLISTKGKIISTTGEAISSLGKQIASSAVLAPPKHYGYTYEHPHDHEESYEGPPPSAEEHYSGPSGGDYHGHYSSPSDDDDHAGLLIVKPTKSNLDDHDNLDVEPRKPQPPANLEESAFVNEQPDPHDKDHENQVEVLDHPPPSYDSKDHYSYEPQDHRTEPQIHHGSLDSDPHLSIQPSVEYPPIHLQQIHYAIPPVKETNSLDHGKDTASNYNDVSVYSSFSVDTPRVEPLKISIVDHQAQLPKVQTSQIDFHGLPALHVISPEPLKIPLLNQQLPIQYWQGRSMHPVGINRRKSNARRRRGGVNIARRSILVRDTRFYQV